MRIWKLVALAAAAVLAAAAAVYLYDIHDEAERLEERMQGRHPSGRYL